MTNWEFPLYCGADIYECNKERKTYNLDERFFESDRDKAHDNSKQWMWFHGPLDVFILQPHTGLDKRILLALSNGE